MILFLDTETIPVPMPDEAKTAMVKAPSNYKDPEKIAAYIEKNAEDAWRKLALKPRSNLVVTAACAVRTRVSTSVVSSMTLEELAEEIAVLDWRKDRLVAHNAGWDVWTLWHNFVRAGHKVAAHNLGAALRAKPWDRPIIDTCGAMKVDGDRFGPSLGAACAFFGIPTPKDDIDGSQVYETWSSGPDGEERVKAYCRKDVGALIALYDALVEWGLL